MFITNINVPERDITREEEKNQRIQKDKNYRQTDTEKKGFNAEGVNKRSRQRQLCLFW